MEDKKLDKKALKLAKKAEKKIQAAEKKKQIKRDQLSREIKYGELTIKRYEKDWKYMLFKIAVPRMRDELVFAWHNFEKLVDCKDFTISLLMDEIKTSEEQYMMNFKNHIDDLDRLLSMYNDRLEELRRDNLNQIKTLKMEAEEETKIINESFADGEEYLKTMLFSLELARKEQEQLERVEYFSKWDEEATKFTHIVQTLKGVLENKYHVIYKDTKNFILDCSTKTKERRTEYDALRQVDSSLQTLQKEQIEKIFKFNEGIAINRQKLIHLKNILGQKVEDLQLDEKYLLNAFGTLKAKLEVDRKTDFDKLKLIALEYARVKNHLEQKKEQGEHILKLATTCRQLETQEEKVMAFPDNLLKIPELVPPEYDNQIITHDYLKSMELFWQRVAQVEASRYSINEEREFLKIENKILKQKIHEYCLCLDCPSYTPVKTKPR